MNHLRFTVGIGILLIVLLVFSFVIEPFALENIQTPVIEAAGVIVSGLIAGFFAWVPVRLVRGIDRAPDMENFLFYTTVIFSVISMVYRFLT